MLERQAAPYTIALLPEEFLASVIALQDSIYQEMPIRQKKFILPKSLETVRDQINAGGKIIGILHDQKLIAQSMMANPTSANDPLAELCDLPFGSDPAEATILQSVIVHPDYRGNNLMNKMIAAWIDLAAATGKKHLFARVHIDNNASLAVFLQEGLKVNSMVQRPDSGEYVYNIYASVSALRAPPEPPPTTRLPNLHRKSQPAQEQGTRGERGLPYKKT